MNRFAWQNDYPPSSEPNEFEGLLSAIKDHQITHGTMFKLWRTDQSHVVQSRTLGVSVFPSLFSRSLFEQALALQYTFNKLYATVASDVNFLKNALRPFLSDAGFALEGESEIGNDDGSRLLARSLWAIYEEVEKSGSGQYTECGIFRSDYMIQKQSEILQLKQVEFNTVSCAGGVHANRASDMHRLLARQRAYPASCQPLLVEVDMPCNRTTAGISETLALAHQYYGPARCAAARAGTCVLMIVQPNNFNTADERPIEYMLWQRDPPVPCFRVEFAEEVLERTTLTRDKQLLFHQKDKDDTANTYEVSVVYYRASFEPHEFNKIKCPDGYMSRLRLEMSRAIKCPGILSQLAGFKTVQQGLTELQSLQKHLSISESEELVSTFVPIYPLDDSSKGQLGRRIATDADQVSNYILKPSLDGGGHNIYGEDIVTFLNNLPEERWGQFVLMKRITPPEGYRGVLTGPHQLWSGETISELGVFGGVLWKRSEAGAVHILQNEQIGWSLKTKAAHVDEMSVVKGYGAFDSPLLYD